MLKRNYINHSRLSPSSHGFTLLELMVSMAVIIFVMTLGVPSLMDTLVSNRVNSAVYALNKDIMSARSFAISYENSVTICHLNSADKCDGSWASGYTVFVDADKNAQFDSATDEKLIFRNSISTNDKLVFTDGNSLQFNFDGTVLTDFDNEDLAVFKYCPSVDNAEEYSRAILLNISGRPRASQDIDNDNKDEISGDDDHISCS